jgi:hypothetical protein
VKDLQAKIGQLAMENEWKGHSFVEVRGGRCNDRYPTHVQAGVPNEQSERSRSSPRC